MTSEARWIDVYPLTLRELARLQWLRDKVRAVEFLDAQGQLVSYQQAKRLAFLKFLVNTEALSEWDA